MQIKLTEYKTENPFTMEASLILLSRKDPTEIGATHIITGIQGPGGLQAMKVSESPEEVGLLVNRAAKCDIPQELLGYKPVAG